MLILLTSQTTTQKLSTLKEQSHLRVELKNAAWINEQNGGPVTISSHLELDDYWWKALGL